MARSIQIPDSVSEGIEKRVIKSNFDSVEAYVIFVFREIIRDHPEIEDTEANRGPTTDESRARENLRLLGYLE